MLMCGGGGGGGEAQVDPELLKIAEQAKKAAEKEQEENDKIIKMLLLGAGESGKSTIFKQMKIINKDGYTEKERKEFIAIVHSNTVASMKTLIQAFEKVSVEVPDDLQAMAKSLEEKAGDEEKLDTETAKIVADMWAHPKVQEVFERKSEFQLNDSADYYFKDVMRLGEPGYLPTEQDVLRSRVRTTGIVQSDFKIKGLNFMMFDVGGQRNERRKWIHAFDNVNSVVFVAALSEFDQVLFEDESQNRMEEALSLFDQICNSKWFKTTAMILFLNKKDLFEMKLQKASLSKFFPDYDGDDKSFDEASKFFKKKFLAKNKRDKAVFTHVTCATDTGNVRFVFDAVIAIILEENLKNSGLA